MDRRDDGRGKPQRDQTDESLRAERDKADAHVAEARDAAEVEADRVLRLARDRADQVIQLARDHADLDLSPQAVRSAPRSELARARADVALDHERSVADQLLEGERALRRRYLADFLVVERDATDQDLIGEREHADTVIAARDEFLATVSHDLRSLLSGLALNAVRLARLAPDGAAGDAIRKQAASNQRMVSRMNRLVSDLLDVASIEAGKLALHLDRVEVGDLLRDTVDAFEPIAAAKRIALDTDAQGLPIEARLDGERILQVLANLVSNAIKFTPAEGRVTIQIRGAGGELRFAVSDTGVGIPDAALSAVFERFRQVGPDRRGLGLGLHISKHLVEEHGGRIWAESVLATGSTFYFTIPTTA